MTKSFRLRTAAATVFALTCMLAAQTPRIQLDVDLVEIPVTVTNWNNQYITDLQKEQFRIWEDRVAQKIAYFYAESAPMSLIIVLDTSSSMAPTRNLADSAARQCLKTGDKQDEYSLLLFATRPEEPTPFTTDIATLQGKLLSIKSKGQTALYDAVYNGLVQLQSAANPRRAMAIISDGDDNHSHHSGRDLIRFVREKDLQVYTYGAASNPAILELSQKTGGSPLVMKAGDGASNIVNICSAVVRALKNQYIISYKSTNTARDGTWRQVHVQLTTPEELHFQVRAKAGYYAEKN